MGFQRGKGEGEGVNHTHLFVTVPFSSDQTVDVLNQCPNGHGDVISTETWRPKHTEEQQWGSTPEEWHNATSHQKQECNPKNTFTSLA